MTTPKSDMSVLRRQPASIFLHAEIASIALRETATRLVAAGDRLQGPSGAHNLPGDRTHPGHFVRVARRLVFAKVTMFSKMEIKAKGKGAATALRHLSVVSRNARASLEPEPASWRSPCHPVQRTLVLPRAPCDDARTFI
jgi:hypothetical protein